MPCLVYQNSWYICAWCGRQKHPREQQQSCPELPREPPRQASGMIWTGSTGISSVPNWNFQLVSLHKIMSMQDKFQIWGDHLRKREEVKYWYKLVYLNFFWRRGHRKLLALAHHLIKPHCKSSLASLLHTFQLRVQDILLSRSAATLFCLQCWPQLRICSSTTLT